MRMFVSTKTQGTKLIPSSSPRILWLLVILTILLSLPVLPYLIALPLLIVFASDGGSSGGLIALGVVIGIGGVLFALFHYLFSRKKLIIGILLLDLMFVSSTFFLYDLEALKEFGSFMGHLVGIRGQSDIPAGSLDLPDEVIPSGYFLKEEHGGEWHTKEYAEFHFPGKDFHIIRYSYEDSECRGFYLPQSSTVEIATCKAGPCVLDKSSPLPEFQINDNGACASIAFSALKDNSLTREEAQHIVDSLVRVPGERPQRSFEEKAKPTIKSIHAILEFVQKRNGFYNIKERVAIPLTLSQDDCVSTLQVDIAPDQQSFVIHRPVCPDNGMSYCIENGQGEITTVPTALVEKTFHCK